MEATDEPMMAGRLARRAQTIAGTMERTDPVGDQTDPDRYPGREDSRARRKELKLEGLLKRGADPATDVPSRQYGMGLDLGKGPGIGGSTTRGSMLDGVTLQPGQVPGSFYGSTDSMFGGTIDQG